MNHTVTYTRRYITCTLGTVERVNITLDYERAEKSSALDETDADAANVSALLDGIPDALTRAELGREQAYAGKTISLDQRY